MEGAYEYTLLLYIPERAPFDLWVRERRQGMKLYVRRVFIMDDAEQLMPNYLRFVRGIVDSNDLPLNVSREILQHNRLIETIRSNSVKKVLGLLNDLVKQQQREVHHLLERVWASAQRRSGGRSDQPREHRQTVALRLNI